jgi:hypothetical protein
VAISDYARRKIIINMNEELAHYIILSGAIK